MTTKSEEKEEGKMKRGEFRIAPGLPMEKIREIECSSSNVSDEQREMAERVKDTWEAYLAAAKELLEGQYRNLKDLVPQYLSDPKQVWIMCCEDGIVVRYDYEGEHELFAGWGSYDLSQLAPMLSENAVHCYPDENFESMIPKTGPKLEIKAFASPGEPERVLSSARIGFEAVVKPPSKPLPTPPDKPYRLVSVRSSLEIHFVLETIPEGPIPPKRFLVPKTLRLPVGWERFEIFAFFDPDHWKPEYAKAWAEKDILAEVVAHQLKEKNLQTLDPDAAARKKFLKLLNSYRQLLDSDPDREETLQKFLKENPVLLCAAHTRFWPKLPFGARVSDFVFQEASGEYLLVELELHSKPLFRQDGDTSGELKEAQNQIIDWKRYIEDNLSTVQRELGLTGISINPKSLIVIGRSHSLTPDNRRKLTSIENESPKTKIMTYDDVLENAKAIGENILGPFWDETGSTEVYYLPEGTSPFPALKQPEEENK